ncbi:MAG: hypothetical protein IT580_07605, partial [Verrucomicrobiales bacterium]|nr:hypothetical protein [Verrucomicrobiales bacterium]
ARPGFNSEGTVVFQSASDAWRPGDGNRSADVYLADVASGNVGLISTRTGGGAGALGGGRLVSTEAASADGRRVLFASLSDDLSSVDARGQVDLWVRDMTDGRTLLATPPGAEGGPSRPGFGEAVLSANGRHVAFSGDLLVTKADGSRVWTPQVFVRDLALGRSRTLALNPDGEPATMRTVSQVQISADGRYVAFQTDATTLVEGSGSRGQVILRDLVAQKTWLVAPRGAGGMSHSLAGLSGRVLVVQGGAAESPVVVFDPGTERPVELDEPVGVSALLSYDGARVVVAAAGDAGVGPGRVRWRDAGGTLLREVNLPNGAQGTNQLAALSRDGRWAAVRTGSASLGWVTWLVDGETGQATRVEAAAGGDSVEGIGVRSPSLSANGRWLAFESASTAWVTGDANGAVDVFVRDGRSQETRRVERNRDGSWETDAALRPILSADARRLVFMSRSGAFAAEDDNGASDVFSLELGGSAPEDQDGDGLDDSWERAWFGNLSRDGSVDDDGDGATARDEFRAGTSPLDDSQRPSAAGELRLTLVNEVPGGWTITWQSEAGRRYRVQSNDSVTGGVWVEVGEGVIGNGSVVRMLMPTPTQGERFYRVAAEP